MTLGATNTNVAEGDFAGVELNFMGLNNQNQHNVLFRGFPKAWETWTSTKINWIDLAQADHNARLQQSIATGFPILPGSDDVYNNVTGAWDTLPSGPNFAPDMAYIGWGVYVMAKVDSDEKKKKAAWSAAADFGGKDIALWMAAYPSGFQPYHNSQFNYEEWTAAGYDAAFVEDYPGSNPDSYNHPDAAIEPRIPGIFQYYSAAEDELAKDYAGQYKSAQETADAIAAAWEKLTDQIGRDSQIALYKASLGM